jgi:uncharacterized membrane protein
VWFRSLAERFRQSLFFVPALFVVAGLLMAQLLLELDSRISTTAVPAFARTTVPSARALMAAVAGGTITAAALVVSLTLVAVQVAASQFSPRTLRGFIGDRFQQVMIGLVVGTFAYSLWVLRAVRTPVADGGSPVLPQVSVAVGAVLGIVALLAVLASIDHTARSLRVEAVALAIQRETLDVIESRYGGDEAGLGAGGPRTAPTSPAESDAVRGEPVVADQAGWVQQIDERTLAEAVPEGSTVRLEVVVGGYVLEGGVLALVETTEPLGADARSRLVQGIALGHERTMQQDIAYGVVRLVDIGVRALSPGINDPHTAEEIVARLGSVVLELLSFDVGSPDVVVADRTVVQPHALSHDDFVDLAFTSIRRHAADEPHVLVVLLRTIRTLVSEVERRSYPASTQRLRLHEVLVLESLDAIGLAADEVDLIAPDCVR